MLMATVIGDVVRSRSSDDRGALHARLAEVLAEMNAALDPVTPLRVTVGDEYQGGFATVGDAVRATLRLRLALAPDVDVRHGIGWGETTGAAGGAPGRGRPRLVGRARGDPRGAPRPRSGPGPGCGVRSSGVPTASRVPTLPRSRPCSSCATSWSESSRSGRCCVLRGLLDGTTQRELADDLGVTALGRVPAGPRRRAGRAGRRRPGAGCASELDRRCCCRLRRHRPGLLGAADAPRPRGGRCGRRRGCSACWPT